MREFLIVLRFELKTMLSKKSFLISTIIVMLGAIVLFSLPRFISNDGQDNNGAVTKDKKMLVYDQMDVLKNQLLMQQSFPEYEIQFVDSLSEVKDQVKDGKVDAGFEIRNSSEFVYYVENSSLNDMTSSRFESMMKQNFQTSELKKLGYDVNKVQKVYQSAIASETQVLGKDGKSNYFYTYVLILLLYMMILIYGNQIGVGVATEKSNRAIEILTTSCSSNALIFGKVMAGAITGIIQTSLMVGSFLLSYSWNAQSWNYSLDRFLNIPSSVLLTFAMFGILGYLLFSFLFGAIGALCSKVEEVNGATLPLQLFIVAVFLISMVTLQIPDTLFAKIVCYIPFTSWMCMFVNVALGSVSFIEVIISLLLLAITTLCVGFIGAKLYRRGTLSYGNHLKLKKVLFKK
ncbi:ABC transporter permease [Amedibacterium intestinale]|uniref:ABC transporter permease n=1 Tax=Amedibacterium intestinale TaxID=2583452 RepID=UPI000E201C9F